jgi:hypothetical protein
MAGLEMDAAGLQPVPLDRPEGGPHRRRDREEEPRAKGDHVRSDLVFTKMRGFL